MHDQLASTMALARSMLMGINPEHENTLVRTASLKLLLDTLVELGTSAPTRSMNSDARRTVAGHLATFEAEKDPFEEEQPRRGRL